MAGIDNIGTPQFANRAFVPLALAAGIEAVIESFVPLATDKITLLLQVVEALQDSNKPLADALNTQTLDAILAYMSAKPDAEYVNADDLPAQLDEPGGTISSIGRDGGAPAQVNLGFSAPPSGYTYEIYINEQRAKAGNLAASGGFVFEALFGVPTDSSFTVRVLFVNADGALTRFGNTATIPAASSVTIE